MTLRNDLNNLQFIGSMLFSNYSMYKLSTIYIKHFEHETTLKWKKYCLNSKTWNSMSTLKHTIQKKRKTSIWLPDQHSLHHLRLVFFFKKWHSYSQDAYIHKSKRAELPIFSFYITKLDDSVLTEYILCRKCHTDHLVCVCVYVCGCWTGIL